MREKLYICAVVISLVVCSQTFAFDKYSPESALKGSFYQPKPLSEKEAYIKSTKRMGNSKAPIYLKEFLKNPDNFIGTRINFIGKIMDIEESKGDTFIQAIVSNDIDVINIIYHGSIKIYKDDVVIIYGEGAGKISGQNRMGADMTWPLVGAKYIIKKKSLSEG